MIDSIVDDDDRVDSGIGGLDDVDTTSTVEEVDVSSYEGVIIENFDQFHRGKGAGEEEAGTIPVLDGAEISRLGSSFSEDVGQSDVAENVLEVVLVSELLEDKPAVIRSEVAISVRLEDKKEATVTFEARTVQSCVVVVLALSDIAFMFKPPPGSEDRNAVVMPVPVKLCIKDSDAPTPILAINVTPILSFIALLRLSNPGRSGSLLLLDCCQVWSTTAVAS